MRKHKRKRAEMEDEEKDRLKEEVKEITKAKIEAHDEILELKQALFDLEERNNRFTSDSAKLKKLFREGVIDQDGNPLGI